MTYFRGMGISTQSLDEYVSTLLWLEEKEIGSKYNLSWESYYDGEFYTILVERDEL